MIRRLPPPRRAALVPALLLIVAAVAGVGGVGPEPAAAMPEPPGDCTYIEPSGTRCRIGTGGPPPADGEHVVRAIASPPAPFFRPLRYPVPTCDADGAGGWTPLTDLASAVFDLTSTLAPDPVEPGYILLLELNSPAGVGQNTGFLTCVGDGEPEPALPPPLPTAGEIWGEALTYEPAVNLDPFVRGLTGLETYMWYEGATADTVTLTLNGYVVTATIGTVGFAWDMDGPGRDGVAIHRSTVPGSADAPAATHLYAEPEEVTVIHEITWTGTSVVTGPGLPPGGLVVDLGTAVLATARDYQVIEVRTPLVRNGNG